MKSSKKNLDTKGGRGEKKQIYDESAGNRTGQLCNAKLRRHEKVFQGIYGEVCICK